MPPDETFFVPEDVLGFYRAAGSRGRAERERWQQVWAGWTDDRAAIEACLEQRGVEGWEAKLPTWSPGEKVATRNAGKACIDAILDVVPPLMGGGADLTGNTGTQMPDEAGVFSKENRAGRQIHFGVREHGMAAAMNGMAMHGGIVPVGGTFFIFSDYMRPSVRLAALSEAKVIYSWTHDSVGLGEDGPTHQPIEHLMSLRAIPGLRVIRPADANETAMAYRIAVNSTGPTGMVLSRQNLPVLEGTASNPGVERGAYVLRDTDDRPDLILIGTGSEVSVAARSRRPARRRRHERSGGVHAVLGALRGADRQVPRQRAQARHTDAGRRGGRHLRLAHLGRRRGRHRPVRRQRAGRCRAGEPRHQSAERGRPRPRPTRAIMTTIVARREDTP